MGIRVLKAVARGGKTEWAATQARHSAFGLLKSPFVLLPSRMQVDDFKQRLANQGGTMGVYLGTFRDLCREILDRSEINLMVISETVQIKLLQSIVENLPLNYFQKIIHKPGFAQTLLAIVRELESGMIEPDSFQIAVREIDRDGRLRELGLIYQEYRDRLQRSNWVDPTGFVWRAADLLSDQPENCPEWDSLIVDGFDDLSPVQTNLIILLARLLPDVTVTITGTEGGSERPLVHKRFNQLRAELEEEQEIEFISLPRKKKEAEGIFEKLEINLFSTRLEEPVAAGDRIKMVAVPDREAEIRAALRWIKELISAGQVEPGETALIMRNLEPYRKLIYKVSQEYQLPVFIRGGLPLDENPAISAVLSLLDLASAGKDGLIWHDVVSLWQSPYFDLRILSSGIHEDIQPTSFVKEAKQLSDIARWGSVIQGFEQWKEAFERLIGIQSGSGDIPSRSSIPGNIPTGESADELWKKLESFVNLITPPKDGMSVEEYLFWVEDLLGDLNLEEERTRGLNLFQMAHEGGLDLFQRDYQALRKLTELFRDQIWSDIMFGSKPTTFQNVVADLKSQIKRISYQISPENKYQIICADCTEVRGVSFNAVALVGLAEGEFPGTISEDPFLRNEDREVLKDTFGFPIRLSTESAEAEFFYEAITRASGWLLITRPRIADNGAPWQPSPYWEELLRITDVTPEMNTSQSVPSLETAASRSELFEVIASAGLNARKELLKEAKGLYPEFLTQLSKTEYVIKVRTGESEISDLKFDGGLEHLSRELRIRYPEEYVWSPSRLENYQTCPYSFFVNNLLGLEKVDPPQEGLDARQLGNIYHHIMEDLYLEIGVDYDIQGLLALLPDVARKVFAEAPTREGFRETAWWHHTQREILTNIQHSLIVLEGMDGSFSFYRAEQKFGIGNDSAPQLDISIEGVGTYHLRGLIDRVDINDRGNLRIIDYKTSSPFGFDNQAVREGKKLQLPLYALAAQDGLQLGNVQEGFYFHVRSAQPSSFKMSAFWNDGDRGPQAAINNAIFKGWLAVSSIQKGLFSPLSPGNGCPSYCPAVDFCWQYNPQIW